MNGRTSLSVIAAVLAVRSAIPSVANAWSTRLEAALGHDFARWIAGSSRHPGGTLDCCLVDLDAHSGPAGEDAWRVNGLRTSRRAFFTMRGPVGTCLNVTGNETIVGLASAQDPEVTICIEVGEQFGRAPEDQIAFGPPGSLRHRAQPVELTSTALRWNVRPTASSSTTRHRRRPANVRASPPSRLKSVRIIQHSLAWSGRWAGISRSWTDTSPGWAAHSARPRLN